jgi:hypothetical protein
VDDIADVVLEGIVHGRKVAVEPDNGDARKLPIVGVLGNVPVDMRAWLTPKRAYRDGVVTATSQSSESAMPIMTSASTPPRLSRADSTRWSRRLA